LRFSCTGNNGDPKFLDKDSISASKVERSGRGTLGAEGNVLCHCDMRAGDLFKRPHAFGAADIFESHQISASQTNG
jgi:hypothetical protein